MNQQNEFSQFEKYFRWYVFALIFALISALVILYINQGYISIEFIIASMFIAFLASVVYLGSYILYLKKEVDELRKKVELLKK